MTPEEQRIADSLGSATIQRIDQSLLDHATSRRKKVAMLVANVMCDPIAAVPGLPDDYYCLRVRELVERGKLVAFGDPKNMRNSEVQLPDNAPAGNSRSAP